MTGVESTLLFVAAVLLLMAGHVVRLARWSILMRQVGTPTLGIGFLALSLGYVLDAVLPLRLGEIARGAFYARRTRADLPFVLASVVVERCLDLVAVWAITLGLFQYGVFGPYDFPAQTVGTVGAAAAIFVAVLATSRVARFRLLVWRAASVFNDGIRVTLLDTLWSTVEVFREGRSRYRMITIDSLLMWTLYVVSFHLLALSLGISLQQVFTVSLGTPLLPMIVPMLRQVGPVAVGLATYSFAPLFLFLAYAAMKRRFGVSVWGAVAWMQHPKPAPGSVPRSASRFVESSHYGDFLARRFQGSSDLVADFEDNALRDIVVQRMMRGGSDALTVMVQLGDELRIRKYAAGPAAEKLEAQCDWLDRHANLVPVVRTRDRVRAGVRFHYDMEYSATSRDLFDMVHMSGVVCSWRMLSDVMGSVASMHRQTKGPDADDACVSRYVSQKVVGNLLAIKEVQPDFFEQGSMVVNGIKVDLSLLDRFADEAFLLDRIRSRGTATIHGDLTVENVLVDSGRPCGWFLIDPNVGNVFESPLLDFAKLFQSLHLGYESLNRDMSCSYDGAFLAFPNTRSAQYARLYDHACAWLLDTLGEAGLREVRLHEIVHYFRLTPYKFRKGTEAGLVFLGCLCLLVHEYFEDYETC